MAPDFRIANIYFKSEYPKLYSEKIKTEQLVGGERINFQGILSDNIGKIIYLVFF